ncbi:hypothetical protein ABK040_013259 [Willaertia magna]
MPTAKRTRNVNQEDVVIVEGDEEYSTNVSSTVNNNSGTSHNSSAKNQHTSTSKTTKQQQSRSSSHNHSNSNTKSSSASSSNSNSINNNNHSSTLSKQQRLVSEIIDPPRPTLPTSTNKHQFAGISDYHKFHQSQIINLRKKENQLYIRSINELLIDRKYILPHLTQEAINCLRFLLPKAAWYTLERFKDQMIYSEKKANDSQKIQYPPKYLIGIIRKTVCFLMEPILPEKKEEKEKIIEPILKAMKSGVRDSSDTNLMKEMNKFNETVENDFIEVGKPMGMVYKYEYWGESPALIKYLDTEEKKFKFYTHVQNHPLFGSGYLYCEEENPNFNNFYGDIKLRKLRKIIKKKMVSDQPFDNNYIPVFTKCTAYDCKCEFYPFDGNPSVDNPPLCTCGHSRPFHNCIYVNTTCATVCENPNTVVERMLNMGEENSLRTLDIILGKRVGDEERDNSLTDGVAPQKKPNLNGNEDQEDSYNGNSNVISIPRNIQTVDVTSQYISIRLKMEMESKYLHPVSPWTYCPPQFKEDERIMNLTFYQRFMIEQYISKNNFYWEDLFTETNRLRFNSISSKTGSTFVFDLSVLRGKTLTETVQILDAISEKLFDSSNLSSVEITNSRTRVSRKQKTTIKQRRGIRIIDGIETRLRQLVVCMAKVSKSNFELQGPHVDQISRVARQYGEDKILRVSFDEIDQSTISRFLDSGIEMGGRRYEALCYSSSGLRERKYFFIATCGVDIVEPIEIKNVFKWMGDFSKIKIVSKLAARLGQAFSGAVPTIRIEEDQLVEIPDVIRPRPSGSGEFNFTDGCGEISFDFAKEITEKYYPELSYVPSVFQIRCGPLKGVLVANPKLTKRIEYRPSMKKFDIHNPTPSQLTVEVCKLSSHRRNARLNRQFLHVLVGMCKDDESKRILEQYIIQRLRAMLSEAKNSITSREVALRMLKSQLSEDDTNICQQAFYPLMAGYDLDEPFIKMQLHRFRKAQFKFLLEKSQVELPESRTVFGVCDRYNVLKPGQVCISVPTQDNGSYIPIIGKVLVGKNPCVHPGDIRILEAVRRDELLYVHNAIVFSTQGDRPDFHKISGSDLDGDEYWVCWDKDVIELLEEREPGEYPDKTVQENIDCANESLDEIIRKLKDYFVQYESSKTILGKLSNLHCAIADKFGVRSDEAIQLAEKCSEAVDSAKTGLVVQIPTFYEQFKDLPHYMQDEDEDCSSNRTYYKSTTLIGQIHDAVKEYMDEIDKLVNEGLKTTVSIDKTLLLDSRLKYIDTVSEDFENYSNEVKSIEEKLKGQYAAELKSSEYKKLNDKYRCKFLEISDLTYETQLSIEQRLAKASACYDVCYNKAVNKRQLVQSAFLSYPWSVCLYEMCFLMGRILGDDTVCSKLQFKYI